MYIFEFKQATLRFATTVKERNEKANGTKVILEPSSGLNNAAWLVTRRKMDWPSSYPHRPPVVLWPVAEAIHTLKELALFRVLLMLM